MEPEFDEEDEQITTANNRGSLSFLEDEDEQQDSDGTTASKLVDDVHVSVISCDKEGNDYNYTIKVGVADVKLPVCHVVLSSPLSPRPPPPPPYR